MGAFATCFRISGVLAISAVTAIGLVVSTVGCGSDEDGTDSVGAARRDVTADAGGIPTKEPVADTGEVPSGEPVAPVQDTASSSSGPVRFWLNDQELNGSSVVLVNPSAGSRNCLFMENRTRSAVPTSAVLGSLRRSLLGETYGDFLLASGDDGSKASSTTILPGAVVSVDLWFNDNHDPRRAGQEGWTDTLSFSTFLNRQFSVRLRAEPNAPISHSPCATASLPRASVVPDPALTEHPPLGEGYRGPAAAFGNYLYVPAAKKGLRIYDASVGSRPVYLKNLADVDPELMGSVNEVFVRDTHLIVSGGGGTALYTFLVDSPGPNEVRLDPQNPRLVDTIEPRLAHAAQTPREIYYATDDTVGRLTVESWPNWHLDVQETPVLVRDPSVHSRPFSAIAVSGDSLLVGTADSFEPGANKLLQYRLSVAGRGLTATLVSEHDLNIVSLRTRVDVVELDGRRFVATQTLTESTYAPQLTLFEIPDDATRPLERAYDYKLRGRWDAVNATFAFNDRLALATFFRISILEVGPSDQLELNQDLTLATHANVQNALHHFNFIYAGRDEMGVYQLQ